jgi:hypothetical protein
MKSGLIGASVGLFLGLILGTALFGPIGGAVGIVLGSIMGFSIVTPVAVAYVNQATKKPFTVECPETHREVEVTLNSKRATRAELWNKRQRIETCSRFDGPPDCDEACVDKLDL